jgi:hypothetical protein
MSSAASGQSGQSDSRGSMLCVELGIGFKEKNHDVPVRVLSRGLNRGTHRK